MGGRWGSKYTYRPFLSVGNVRTRTLQVLVLSGKGGVGKSTVTAMLARALAADPAKEVAVVDVDICGPSLPRMFGTEGEEVHQSMDGWSPVQVGRSLLARCQFGALLHVVVETFIHSFVYYY